MTTEEFSNEFDTLLNSYNTSNPTTILQFDEYEKSVFLTAAQEKIISSYYSGNNTNYNSFEKTEEVRRCLDALVTTIHPEKLEHSQYPRIVKDSKIYSLPNNIWYITHESAVISAPNKCFDKSIISVVPVTQEALDRILENPFKGATNKRILRIDSSFNVVELISKYDIEDYIVTYLSEPEPIILTELPEELSINGKTNINDCKLNSVIHRTILETAVALAIKSRISGKSA